MAIKRFPISKSILGLSFVVAGLILTACNSSFQYSTITLPVDTIAAPTSSVEDISISGVSSNALALYVNNCASCHGITGEGSTIAPPLNSRELRSRIDDLALRDTIANGRSGTTMPAWGNRLAPEQIDSLVTLIRNWGTLDEQQLDQLAQQPPTDGCGWMRNSGMGMGSGMAGRWGMREGYGSMMGNGCGRGVGSPWRSPSKP